MSDQIYLIISKEDKNHVFNELYCSTRFTRDKNNLSTMLNVQDDDTDEFVNEAYTFPQLKKVERVDISVVEAP